MSPFFLSDVTISTIFDAHNIVSMKYIQLFPYTLPLSLFLMQDHFKETDSIAVQKNIRRTAHQPFIHFLKMQHSDAPCRDQHFLSLFSLSKKPLNSHKTEGSSFNKGVTSGSTNPVVSPRQQAG